MLMYGMISVMSLTNGIILDATSLPASVTSSSPSASSPPSSPTVESVSRESESIWINNLTSPFAGNNSEPSPGSLESMIRSTLSLDHNTSATLLSTLSTITLSPFSSSPTSHSSQPSPSPSPSSSHSSISSSFISPQALSNVFTTTTTEASKSIYLSSKSTSSSSSIVNYTHLDNLNSTLVNFYRTLTNPISQSWNDSTNSTSTSSPFHESLSINDSDNIQSDSIASVLPIASPLSLLSSLSIPSYNAIPSGELINLNESLSSPASPSSPVSSVTSFFPYNNSNISLGNWIDSSLFSPTTSTSTLFSLTFNNGNNNGNNSFTPSNSNLDNLISFWESIPYPKSGYTQLAIILLAFFITIIMIVIVVGNLLVCIAITTEKSLKTVQNWFIASLAVSDLLLGLVIMPFSLAYELMGYWIFGAIWCDIHHALDVLLCTASINNLCLISLDRYWSVTQAVKYLKKRTPSRAIFMICFVWIFSALVSLPPLVGWKNESIEPGECELSKDTGYVVYSSMGSFYVPAIVMVFVYAKIFVAARSRARKHVKKRKLLVSSEVTNDLTKDKSTTTTTCTSMSNPSPPEAREETDDNIETSESMKGKVLSIEDKIAVECKDVNCDNKSSNSICVNCERLKSRKNCEDTSLTPCTTPTILNTPKVTFSPRDTVYGEDNKCCEIGSLHQRECSSPTSVNCSPPQIIIESANSTSDNNANDNSNQSNHSASNNRSQSVTVKNNVKNCSFKESNCDSTSTGVMLAVNLCDNGACKQMGASKPIALTNCSNSLSERKCPKLRIEIDDSIHNYSRSQSNSATYANANSNSCVECVTGNQIFPTSILRSNGLSSVNSNSPTNPCNSSHHQYHQSTGIVSETRLIATDDDSDAIESPISKTSGNFALESKSFLSPSSASMSGFGPGLGAGSRLTCGLIPGSGGSLSGSVTGGLTRSPYGSTMSIADYDDSDLCNDSGEQPECSSIKGTSASSSIDKKSTKGKGKVQYQTPPVTRRHHTPSDAERHKRKIAKARERRATLILGLIMGSFILAWLPFFVMYLTSGLCKSCQITSGLTFGYWLGYCNSAINPIIYTVFNRDFRKAFRKILFR
ncbi:uncharacterized protein LOC107365978 isoform X1 [Tetranychus urticae]|uniref:uncharacterized protein LOC107365978 isoform X1 n=1 Tax=Tetranychus urticae TaxID=32264 RepID=UPI00077BF60E|nr:uncharacterized protein LOC107365978 isoform X1 [Tetranychus urticae]XP_015789046.1 uncharacterized protein LOC107365978 isoform X1 [Tetranychus urticae]